MKARLAILLVLIGLVIIRCGITVTGEVHHIVEVDGTKLEKYFRAKCKNDFPDATDSQLDQCTNANVADFMEKVVSQ